MLVAKKSKFLHSSAGFSLIELSIILAVLSSLTVGFLSWVAPQAEKESQEISITQQRMNAVMQAVENFVLLNNRLPCTASPTAEFGKIYQENTNYLYAGDERLFSNGTDKMVCYNTTGAVPTRAIGLSPEYMLDGWGRKFTFAVSPALCGDPCDDKTYSSNNGNITINDTSGASISTQGAVVLISHGPAGRGAYTPKGGSPRPAGPDINETQNRDYTNNTIANNIFIAGNITSDFQDITIFRTKGQLDNIRSATNTNQLTSTSICTRNRSAITSITDSSPVAAQYNNFNSLLAAYNQSTIINNNYIVEMLYALQEECVANGSGTTRACYGNGTVVTGYNYCNKSTGIWN